MMHGFRTSSILLLAGALAATAACKGKGTGPAIHGSKKGGVKAAVAGKPSSIKLMVKRAFNKPPVAIRLALPADWTEGEHGEVVRLLPKTQPDKYKLQIGEGNASCQGTCDAKQVMASIVAVAESFKQRLATPNRHTGDPKKDAYRAKVEVLVDTEHKGKMYRRIFGAKVTCPNKGTIPCMPQLAARCFHYQEGSDFYLVATGKGPLAAEKSAWPQLMALCKGLEFAVPK